MDSPRGDEQLLPGLENPDDLAGPIGAVERAAMRTIRALEADDLLGERDALLCQSLLTLAHAYDRAANSRAAKEYAIANLHGQLLATIEQLPTPAEGDEDDPWGALERELHTQTPTP